MSIPFQAFATIGGVTHKLCTVDRETGETQVNWVSVELCAADASCPTRGIAQLMLAIRNGKAPHADL